MTTSLVRSLAGGLLLTGMFTSAVPAPAQTLQYPAARKSDVVDDYHGTRVPDPYRWLEDPDSPESRAWIEAQNRLTAAYLAGIPARSTIRERLTKLWNYPRYGTPFRKGRRFFYSRYPEPVDKALTDVNRFQRVYYHRLGTDQVQDVLVYERPDQPDWGMNAEVTDDGRYAVLHVWLGTDRRNRVYYLALRDA